MKSLDSSSLLKSAERLVEGEEEFKKSRDPVWIAFLKRESNILLGRSLKFWWRIRFRNIGGGDNG